MADQRQLEILHTGIDAWNHWRAANGEIDPDLSEADLSTMDLSGASLWGVNLHRANLWRANLREAYLAGADLTEADLSEADLSEADLTMADLKGANLCQANLHKAEMINARLREALLIEANLSHASLAMANLSEGRLGGANLYKAHLAQARLERVDLGMADLREARLRGASLIGSHLYKTNLSGASLREVNLSLASLVETNLSGADLTGCTIYGLSAWGIHQEGAIQNNLRISRADEPLITVDNLEVAQFLYLMLHNEKLRNIIDTVTSKVVLILGRFIQERKIILDTLREELSKRNYIPVLVDFDEPVNRDITELVSSLAHMARFVIADITNARSIPQELEHIVPQLPSVPVQPLLEEGKDEYGMFEHFKHYPWVLEVYHYRNVESLVAALQEQIIGPAERKAEELTH